MNHRRVGLLPLAGLTVVWLMLMGGLSWANVFFGLLLSAFILWLFPLPPQLSTVRPRPLKLVVLLARFFYDLVLASAYVAWLAVRPRPIRPGSLIDIKLRLHDDLRRTLVAEFTSLVPGTVVIDLDQRSGVLTLHVLDIVEPPELARERAKVRALEDRVEAALVAQPQPGASDPVPARNPKETDRWS